MKKTGCSAIFLVAVCLLQLFPCRPVRDAAGSYGAGAAGAVFFTCQVESLLSKTAAKSQVGRLKKRGYPAYINVLTTRSGKQVYKVRIGRYATRAEAQTAGENYRKKERRPFFIVESPRAAAEKKPPPAPGAGKYFTVQVSTKADRAVAQGIADRLGKKGYPVYITEKKTRSGRSLYKTRFGRYRTRAQALHAAHRFQKGEKQQYLIVESRLATALPWAPPAEASRPPKPEIEAKATDSLKTDEKKPLAAVKKEDAVKPVQPTAASGSSPAPTFRKGEAFFTVQISTLLDRAVAERQADRLRKKGYPVYTLKMPVDSGRTIYKTRIGKYRTRARAAEAARAFKRKEKKPFLIVESRWKPPQEVSARKKKNDGPVPRQPPREKTASPVAAPIPVKKVFAYPGPDDELNITGDYSKIPPHLRDRIEYVSVFPVMCIGRADREGCLLFQIDGEKKPVKVSGVKITSFSGALSEYVERNLRDVQLRLKYRPGETLKDGTIVGRIFFQKGSCVNLEMVRQGAASCCLDMIAPDMHEAFKEAEQSAKARRLGIWQRRR